MSATPATDLLEWLAGRWSIERAINGDEGTFTGTAIFTREEPGRTRWQESGHLALGAYSGPATRTLHLLRAGDGTYEVRFDDGRPFHALSLSTGRCDAEHLCGADVYHGTYAIESDDVLHVVWQVDGPRKRDVIESTYRRQA